MFSRVPTTSSTRNGKLVQAKLDIGPVNHPLEHEADRIADSVLRQPDPHRESSAPLRTPDRSSAVSGAGGRPLDPATRAYFEPRFGFDFSKVRVHANDAAAESARSMGALAYTTGPEISFDSGRFQPNSGEGRRLLAHELTHVVQQGAAAPLPGATAVRASRINPLIQRDTPKTTPGPLLPIANAQTMASRTEVVDALTTFLYKVQEQQGGQSLRVDDAVRAAVLRLFAGDPMGSARAEAFLKGITPGSVPEFAAAVGKLLPASIPRSRIAPLATQSAKFSEDKSPKSIGEGAGHVLLDSTLAPILKNSPVPIPKDWQDKIMDGARGAVADGIIAVLDAAMKGGPLDDKTKSVIHSTVEGIIKKKSGESMDRQENGAGSPYAPVQPPPLPAFPTFPGEHIITSPSIPWDIPTNDPVKPQLPKPPLASENAAVDKIIQGLDDQSLIPAAVKGDKDKSDSYASAKELARGLANMLEAANKKKQYSVDLTIPMGYRRQPDLRDIFDKIEAIVKQIAAAIPGGVPNVGEVIIAPAKDKDDKSFPMRRIVHLHGD